MKTIIAIGILFLSIIFVSFTIDEDGKTRKKANMSKIDSQELTGKRVNIDQLTSSEMEKMTMSDFNSYLVEVTGDPGKYIKKYFEAKAKGEKIGLYNREAKMHKLSGKDDCDSTLYQDYVGSPTVSINPMNIEPLNNSAPVEWEVARGNPGSWKVTSKETVYMVDLSSNPFNPDWKIRRVDHETSSFETSCPLLTYYENSTMVFPDFSMPGQATSSSYAFLVLYGMVNGSGYSQAINNYMLIEAN